MHIMQFFQNLPVDISACRRCITTFGLSLSFIDTLRPKSAKLGFSAIFYRLATEELRSKAPPSAVSLTSWTLTFNMEHRLLAAFLPLDNYWPRLNLLNYWSSLDWNRLTNWHHRRHLRHRNHKRPGTRRVPHFIAILSCSSFLALNLSFLQWPSSESPHICGPIKLPLASYQRYIASCISGPAGHPKTPSIALGGILPSQTNKIWKKVPTPAIKNWNTKVLT